ncbi:hypothetical protein P7K49_005823 [Saguinus oedipus]|uniref:E3 ubiquitin-protein transferase MAEA n=1 Tax=Saguinus oedipus TaxID=9490 RepID=A0ABQ9W0N3_SAGOE|nr:hypothetical protein P7K49_005823 [Saguinus oedipus]
MSATDWGSLTSLGSGLRGIPVLSRSVLCVAQAVESIQAEDESAKLCKRRIEHLKEHSSDQPAAASVWKRKRMDRMMVEHLLRCGYYNTAVKLARQSGIEVGACWESGQRTFAPKTCTLAFVLVGSPSLPCENFAFISVRARRLPHIVQSQASCARAATLMIAPAPTRLP